MTNHHPRMNLVPSSGAARSQDRVHARMAGRALTESDSADRIQILVNFVIVRATTFSVMGGRILVLPEIEGPKGDHEITTVTPTKGPQGTDEHVTGREGHLPMRWSGCAGKTLTCSP
jgi:hypothetical protein